MSPNHLIPSTRDVKIATPLEALRSVRSSAFRRHDDLTENCRLASFNFQFEICFFSSSETPVPNHPLRTSPKPCPTIHFRHRKSRHFKPPTCPKLQIPAVYEKFGLRYFTLPHTANSMPRGPRQMRRSAAQDAGRFPSID
jgi:hypothetical protein